MPNRVTRVATLSLSSVMFFVNNANRYSCILLQTFAADKKCKRFSAQLKSFKSVPYPPLNASPSYNTVGLHESVEI